MKDVTRAPPGVAAGAVLMQIALARDLSMNWTLTYCAVPNPRLPADDIVACLRICFGLHEQMTFYVGDFGPRISVRPPDAGLDRKFPLLPAASLCGLHFYHTSSPIFCTLDSEINLENNVTGRLTLFLPADPVGFF